MDKALVIGSGPAGSACSRILAEAGWKVDLFEKRNHIAGNCFDEYDENSVLVHRYGPHYFRTDSIELVKWLSKFTHWIPGHYYVRSMVDGKFIPVPVNLSTFVSLIGKVLTEDEFKTYLEEQRITCQNPINAEEQCLDMVGKELYDLLFKGYTIKQWGIEPYELSPAVTERLPLRLNWDERYPSEKYQIMPKDGYTAMFNNILQHPNIHVELNHELNPSDISKMQNNYDLTIYSGPVDAFFGFEYGKLGYRSLRFVWKHFAETYRQPCVQINYPHKYRYTRTVEIKHVTEQMCQGTTICYEYPQDEGEPFYPILTGDNLQKYDKYKLLVNKEKAKRNPILFLGRLAEYKYFNMDQIFIKAIQTVKNILGK
ncbi:NAD(P)-binding protein [Candidatus Poribacteria bacterium]|nr:NAD(P)-binding protein [Candidatus Poribacteria bacterium]